MPNFTDLSVDLETLGTEPGAVITQIGLAAFNARPNNEAEREIMGQLIHVDPQSCLNLGMHVSWSTISWWLTQDDEARKGMALAMGIPVSEALDLVDRTAQIGMVERFRVWGNGATFDVTLLNELYRISCRKVPWQFRDVRDMRTLVDITPEDKIKWGVAKVAHNAMHDAIAQAQTIRSCFAVD